MRVAKWGNSLAVRLPAVVVEALELKEGDVIELHLAGARQFDVACKPDRDELLKRFRVFRGRLPPDFKFDRDEANARYFLTPTSSSISRRAMQEKRTGRKR